MKSNYVWEDKELRDFYYGVATKRPDQINNGGSGVRIPSTANFPDVEEINKGLDILLYYRGEFIMRRKFKYIRIIESARSKMFEKVYEWNSNMLDEITIPDEKRGEQLTRSKLSRELRSLCNMLDSILRGRPNEMARAIFDIG